MANDGTPPPEKNHKAVPHEHAPKALYDHKAMQDFQLNGTGKSGTDIGHKGPALKELTIDPIGIKQYDTPKSVVPDPNHPNDRSYDKERWKEPKLMPVTPEHFQQIAQKSLNDLFDGRAGINVEHTLNQAFQSDKLHNTHSVDNLLKYWNGQMANSTFSVARQGNKFLFIDSRDQHPDAHGNLNVQPRFTIDMNTLEAKHKWK